MKKILGFLLGLALLLVAQPALAQSFDEWEIVTFDSQIDVLNDGSFVVEETISVIFHEERREFLEIFPLSIMTSLDKPSL